MTGDQLGRSSEIPMIVLLIVSARRIIGRQTDPRFAHSEPLTKVIGM